MQDNPMVVAAIRERMGDGRWYRLLEVARPGVDIEGIEFHLRRLELRGEAERSYDRRWRLITPPRS